MFTLDREQGSFVLVQEHVQIPADTKEFAINMSNMRHWDTPVKRYIDECLAGKDGPRGKDFNMRWIASMVADVHRILTRRTYMGEHEFNKRSKSKELKPVSEIVVVPVELPLASSITKPVAAAHTRRTPSSNNAATRPPSVEKPTASAFVAVLAICCFKAVRSEVALSCAVLAAALAALASAMALAFFPFESVMRFTSSSASLMLLSVAETAAKAETSLIFAVMSLS